jgi:glycosyltransferase involved in cell wall biosynthesis
MSNEPNPDDFFYVEEDKDGFLIYFSDEEAFAEALDEWEAYNEQENIEEEYPY